MQYYDNIKYDWTYTEYVKKLLDKEIDGFKELTDYYKVKKTGRIVLKKSNLFTMASNAYFERISRHYDAKGEYEFSYTREHLVRQLGEKYLQIHPIMFDVAGDYVYKKSTKKYVLKKKVIKIFEKAYLGTIRHHLLDGYGKKVNDTILQGNAVNKTIIRQDGLRSKTKKSVIVMKNLYIPNEVKINVNRLTDAWKMYGELRSYHDRQKKLNVKTERVLKSAGVNFSKLTAYKIEKWTKTINELMVRSNTAPFKYGHVFQLYNERERGGRLYSEGAYGLQNLPKHIRHIIFSNLDYYDYDMVNCHYNILAQLNTLYGGKELKYINEYNNSVSQTRKQISKETDIDLPIIKTLMIALVYGMDLKYTYRPYDYKLKKKRDGDLLKTLINYCGDESSAKVLAERFTTIPLIRGLWSDVKIARSLILSKGKITKASGKDHGYLENHYGKKIKLMVLGEGDKMNPLADGKRLSHMLQGLEAYMMSEIIAESNKDNDTEFLVPYHDGWVCKGAINKKYYEQHISNATMKRMSEYDGVDYSVGLNIKLSGGKMNDPYKKV